uniref:Uncharacterized protein C1093.03 n=1 Tax=Anthurium amnicola TaxID=1678845 RepID=A0A1D1ZIN1_9ARAE
MQTVKLDSSVRFLVVELKKTEDNSRRDTSVVVVVLENSEVYIIVSLSTREDTQVIHVDPTTGALCYQGKLGHDIFISEDEALNYITDGTRWLCKSTIYARAILGYAALGSFGLLLVATKLNATIPNLPGGGCVYTVVESQWIKVQLQCPQSQGKGELKNIQELADLDIDGKHYFCETRDITRPFPSRMPLQDPDSEFVWNEFLSKPFKAIGLLQHCAILLQGFAECRRFGGTGQQEGIVALTARRSRLHPGTRYLARGLNSCFSTGNEVECEQLVWIAVGAGKNIPFSSYVWRRGTIPIWWGAELRLTAAEAEIYVSSHDPYRGSLQYYQRLSKRYGEQNSDLMIVNQKKNPLVPIVCINLLRHGEGKSETILVEHFTESINFVKASGKLPYTRLHLTNYDWHASVKLKGEQQTIEGLWKLLKAPTVAVGFCEGIFSPTPLQLREYNGAVVQTDDVEGGFILTALQNGVIRFNCADSLDRTNAASYFGCLQVFAEQCRRLGISLDRDAFFGFSSTNRYKESGSYGKYSGSLPPGWEERSDAVTGKHYYIDHNTRTTTWEHPCPDKPWKRFDMTFDQFKNSTILYPITQLADLFLLAGDIHATLYTGSKAMHSQILNIFNDDSGKFKQFSAAQNVKITLQRRYQNVLVDSSRQKQLEMFLGIRMFKHLPSVPVHPLQVLSRPPACFLKPLANMFPSAKGEPSLLSFKRKDITWVCSPATDVLELFIYLEEPCHVCQLLVTVSHGADDSVFPGMVDVRTGCNLDELKLVLEGAYLPRCSNGTNLMIPLPGLINPEDLAVTGSATRFHAQGNSYLPLLYNFEEAEGDLNFLTRIVALTFYPAITGRTPITLGEIEILGVSLPWSGMFSKEGAGSKFIEEVQRHKKKISLFQCALDVGHSKNPFLDSDISHSSGASVSDVSVAPVDQTNIFGHGVDLLSGDFPSSQITLQSEVPNVQSALSHDGGFADLFGNAVFDDPSGGPDSRLPAQSGHGATQHISGIQRYLDCFRVFSDKGHALEFEEAMKLEIERLRVNLSAAERDRALLSISVDPATIDPNRLLDDSYLFRLCKLTNTLALLGHSAFEDMVTASIGFDAIDQYVIDFWNFNVIGDTCVGMDCEVHCETQSTSRISSSTPPTPGKPSFVECSLCGKKTCKVCCAGKGAALLAGFNLKETKSLSGPSSQSGSSHGGYSEGSFNGSVPPDGFICRLCCKEEILYALYVDYMRVLTSSRRRDRADSAAQEALKQIIGSEANKVSDAYEERNKCLRKLLNGEESLSEFPYAGFLHSVETAEGSEPLLSLLCPMGVGAWHSYWRATTGNSSIEFSIVLGSVSDVSGVILLVSSCGYSSSDCPVVQIWAGNKINREERSCMGRWDVQSLVRTSELYGPESAGSDRDVPRHVKFCFRNPVRCRIIWVTLTLRKIGSNSVNLEKEYNLLSLDESFLQPHRRASFSGTLRSDPCIHAKRLIVFGSPVMKESTADLAQGSDNMNINAWLERAPKLGRFRVPVEAERLTGNDLVLEQYLSAGAPALAGFRLDAFNIIKPRITHSPSSTDGGLWDSSLTCLEDRHISPAVLHIQVSVVQDSRNWVTVREYRLPEARAGTPMYFDFPRSVPARAVVFKLLGDVAAFADDPAEQEESNFSPLAAGLSMSNRIKLYYYADPYEVGRLATLSAI